MSQLDKDVKGLWEGLQVLAEDVEILWGIIGWGLEKNRSEIFSKRSHAFQEHLRKFFCIFKTLTVCDLVVEFRAEQEARRYFRLPRFNLSYRRQPIKRRVEFNAVEVLHNDSGRRLPWSPRDRFCRSIPCVPI